MTTDDRYTRHIEHNDRPNPSWDRAIHWTLTAISTAAATTAAEPLVTCREW
jgi:hypothetical protein